MAKQFKIHQTEDFAPRSNAPGSHRHLYTPLDKVGQSSEWRGQRRVGVA